MTAKRRLSSTVDAELVEAGQAAVEARGGGADVIDAAVVCLATDGDDILTSDPGDIQGLARAAGVHVELIPV